VLQQTRNNGWAFFDAVPLRSSFASGLPQRLKNWTQSRYDEIPKLRGRRL
jgi:hypothetical protein